MSRPATASSRRVLHVIQNLDLGGAQEVVRSLVTHLPASGWTPVVATLRDGPLAEVIRAGGTDVHVIRSRHHSMLSARGLIEIAGIRDALRTLCAEEGISIVQTHLLRSMDFVALSLRANGGVRGVLWTVHNSRLDLRADQLRDHLWLLRPKRLGYRWSYRLGARLGGQFVAVSHDVGSSIVKQIRPLPDRVHVIPNGVDVDRYPSSTPRAQVRRDLGIDESSFVLVSVAKLHEQKGHRDLLAAARLVIDGHPNVTVLLVGDGPLRKTLEAEAAALGLAGHVRFLGTRSDVPELLAASDLFVLASHWEGLPMALLEAMASGLPSVATDVSGTREVSAPGRTGQIVPVGRPDRLAQAVTNMYKDRALARAMGVAAREHVVRHHSVGLQAARHAALYASAIALSDGIRQGAPAASDVLQ